MDSTSIQKESFPDVVLNSDKIKHGKPTPKAKFSKIEDILCHLFFFLIGVCHYMPLTFFNAANNYWLYKFGNSDDYLNNTSSAGDRTFWQKNFGSSSMVANTIPIIALGIFNIVYANQFKIINRIMLTLGITFTIFSVLTLTTQVNTNGYQVPFFFVVMLFYAIISGSGTVNMVASMNLYTRFPQKYMKTAFAGEGSAGFVGSILNVITVAIFSGQLVPATLVYFSCGTFVVGLTFIMTIIMSRNQVFIECIESVTESKETPTIYELKSAFKKLLFAVIILATVMAGLSATHTAITSLVVSEKDSKTSIWAKDYFTPVMTFLLTDASFLVGRVTASFSPINMPNYLILILAGLRLVTISPAIWLCNAQPRKHLPVLFGHDYQYGIVIFVSQFTLGYFMNVSFAYIANIITNPKEADIAYTVFGLCANVLQTITAPIGLFIVNIL